MEVLKNKYCSLFHNKETETLDCIWNSQSYYMPEDEFKRFLLQVVDISTQEDANYIFCDNREFLFTMDDHFHQWHDINVAIPLSQNMRKMAFVQSPDFFTQVSVEQIFEEDHGKNMPVRHFEDSEEAKAWLLQN
ncbi:SpoIIAA family protein [Sediminitomix flava]|nr:STAS/SEC14 domain-containing protein [Sediminitomix flava]